MPEPEREVLAALRAKKMTLATAESCTGGWLGKRLTDIPGSSEAYLGGVISYTDGVKAKLLGVRRESLEREGAVSETVAREMAEGARRALGADFAAATTGLAGPDGDGSGKPVGLVYIAVAGPDGCECRSCRFSGDREAVRREACRTALEMLLEAIQ